MSIHTAPTPEEEQRAKWDLLLTDLEVRLEQLRQLKTFEPRRLIIQGVTAGAAIFGSGAALMALLLHLGR
jgi:hypothetical protein